jgi:hypothetical protein
VIDGWFVEYIQDCLLLFVVLEILHLFREYANGKIFKCDWLIGCITDGSLFLQQRITESFLPVCSFHPQSHSIETR